MKSPVYLSPQYRKYILAGVLAGLSVVIAFSIYILAVRQSNNPEQVFNESLSLALQTRQFEQNTTQEIRHDEPVNYGSDNSSGKILYEIRDPRSPKISYSVTQDDGTMEAYGTSKNSYIRFTKLKSEDLEFLKLAGAAEQLNQWKLTRDNGKTVDPGLNMFVPTDPRAELLGEYIFGNFNDSDRDKLLKFIKSNNLYEYDENLVKEEKLNGDPVFVYDVKLDPGKVGDYSKMAAQMFGISDDDVEAIIERQKVEMLFGAQPITHAKMYVSLKTKRLIKVAVSDDKQSIETNYSNFNNVSFPAEPSNR